MIITWEVAVDKAPPASTSNYTVRLTFFYICFTSAGWIPVTSSTWVPTESRGWTGKDSWWERINQLAWDPWFVTSTGILWQYSGTEFSFHFFFKTYVESRDGQRVGHFGGFPGREGISHSWWSWLSGWCRRGEGSGLWFCFLFSFPHFVASLSALPRAQGVLLRPTGEREASEKLRLRSTTGQWRD